MKINGYICDASGVEIRDAAAQPPTTVKVTLGKDHYVLTEVCPEVVAKIRDLIKNGKKSTGNATAKDPQAQAGHIPTPKKADAPAA